MLRYRIKKQRQQFYDSLQLQKTNTIFGQIIKKGRLLIKMINKTSLIATFGVAQLIKRQKYLLAGSQPGFFIGRKVGQNQSMGKQNQTSRSEQSSVFRRDITCPCVSETFIDHISPYFLRPKF